MHNSTNAHQGGQCGFALPPLMDSPKTQRRALLALPLPVQRPPCGENTAQPNDTSNRQQHIRPTDIQIIEICKLRKEIVLHTNSGRWKYGREPCCSHRHISKKRHEKNYDRDQQNCQCVFTFCRQEQYTANRC